MVDSASQVLSRLDIRSRGKGAKRRDDDAPGRMPTDRPFRFFGAIPSREPRARAFALVETSPFDLIFPYAIALLCIAFFSSIAHASTPPNIVFIIADDQTYTDYGFMGNESVHTPNLDRLAAKSARFVNGYNTTSVCRPSLVTLLTGLYPRQHGIHFNHGPPGNSGYNRMSSRGEYERVRREEFELIQRVKRLPAMLAEAKGYQSFQTGKFWEGHWRNGGFTEGMTLFQAPDPSMTFGGLRVLAGGQRVAHGNGDAGLAIGRTTMQPIYDFIDRCEQKEQPWLVWYAPYLPHQPHDAPRRFYDLAKRRPNVHPNELPYFASIAQFDHTVGELVRYVETNSRIDETLFVFVADNGWSPSRNPQRGRPQEFAHTKESKRSPFEDGLRTPILFRWDGVITSKSHEELVSAIDIVPTILDIAGLGEPWTSELPGQSLFAAAKGDALLNAHRAVFGAVYPGDATSLGNPARDVAYRWVRQGDLKLVVPHSQQGTKLAWGGYLDRVSLFDVVADPSESINLAEDAPFSASRQRLQALLDQWWSPDHSEGSE